MIRSILVIVTIVLIGFSVLNPTGARAQAPAPLRVAIQADPQLEASP